MTTCPTCDGRGTLDKTLHWSDCPPGCSRQHASTCIVCFGVGKVSEGSKVFTSTVNRRQKFIAVSVFPPKERP